MTTNNEQLEDSEVMNSAQKETHKFLKSIIVSFDKFLKEPHESLSDVDRVMVIGRVVNGLHSQHLDRLGCSIAMREKILREKIKAITETESNKS